MIKAVYPGSFDPVTFGHLDIITRASKVVDELIIGVLINQKKTPLFTMDERLHLLQEATKEFPNVTVKAFEGLTVEFAKENNTRLIIGVYGLLRILNMRCSWLRSIIVWIRD